MVNIKYNELIIENNKTQYIFVTRGRSKPFSYAEAIEYFEAKNLIKDVVVGPATESVEIANDWNIPNNRQRKVMFLKDLNMGVDFCAKKYGVSKEKIVDEAKRVAPHLNTRIINE